MKNNNQTINSELMPETTESYTNMLRKKQAEYDGSITGMCVDSRAVTEAFRRVVAKNITNARFLNFSAEKLREEMDEELIKYFAEQSKCAHTKST